MADLAAIVGTISFFGLSAGLVNLLVKVTGRAAAAEVTQRSSAGRDEGGLQA